MAVDYETILQEGWNDLPDPMDLPPGSWRLKCRGATYRAGEEGAAGQAIFSYEAVEPMDNVDQDALAQIDSDSYGEAKLFAKFFVESRADWKRVMQHVAKHGVDLTDVKDPLKACKGKDVLATIGTRRFKRKDKSLATENTLSNFAPLDE